MKFAKLIVEHLKKNGDTQGVEELSEFLEEFEKAVSSDDSGSEEMEFFKNAMQFFNEEAYQELLNYDKDKQGKKEDSEENE